jgi:hypothetical protein
MSDMWEQIVEHLEMYWCPRCMRVDCDGADGWELVDTGRVWDLVCPDCLTQADLDDPERAVVIENVDRFLRRLGRQ